MALPLRTLSPLLWILHPEDGKGSGRQSKDTDPLALSCQTEFNENKRSMLLLAMHLGAA